MLLLHCFNGVLVPHQLLKDLGKTFLIRDRMIRTQNIPFENDKIGFLW
jgi:hypothetical protein